MKNRQKKNTKCFKNEYLYRCLHNQCGFFDAFSFFIDSILHVENIGRERDIVLLFLITTNISSYPVYIGKYNEFYESVGYFICWFRCVLFVSIFVWTWFIYNIKYIEANKFRCVCEHACICRYAYVNTFCIHWM